LENSVLSHSNWGCMHSIMQLWVSSAFNNLEILPPLTWIWKKAKFHTFNSLFTFFMCDRNPVARNAHSRLARRLTAGCWGSRSFAVEYHRTVTVTTATFHHTQIIIIIFIFQNKKLQPTVITIRQPENWMINKAGCLWLQLKYGINYTMNKTKKNYAKCVQQGAKKCNNYNINQQNQQSSICNLVVKYNFIFKSAPNHEYSTPLFMCLCK